MNRRWEPVPGFSPKSGGQFLREVGSTDKFMFRVYVGRMAGRRVYPSEVFHGTLRDAKVRFATFYSEQKSMVLDSRAPRTAPTTLEALVAEWLEFRRKRVVPKTLRSYRDDLANYVLPMSRPVVI